MNGPMPAICRRSASRLVTNLFFGSFVVFTVGLHIYVAMYATKEGACDNIFLFQAPDLASLAAFLPSIQPPQRSEQCNNSDFLKGCNTGTEAM